MTLGLERVDVIEGGRCCRREFSGEDNAGITAHPYQDPVSEAVSDATLGRLVLGSDDDV